MNKNSNTYIITYASVMVVIVAAVLSFASLSLKNIQAENVRIEKMGDICARSAKAAMRTRRRTKRPISTSSIKNTSWTVMPSTSKEIRSKGRTRSLC